MKINCKYCGIEIIPPKKKFCCKNCCDKWLYHNSKSYKNRVIRNSKSWGISNPEKRDSIHKKAMKKYIKTDGFRNSVLKNYHNNKDKWASRKLTMKLMKNKEINLKNKCGHKYNLEIHHETYPTSTNDIIEAVNNNKIYLLCKKCHNGRWNKKQTYIKDIDIV